MHHPAAQPAQLDHLHQQLQWQVFNDSVMGGRSTSAFAWQAQVLTFSGFVNTNGGGFASMRTQPVSRLLRQSKLGSNPLVSIDVQGDTQRYQLGVQTPAELNYWVDFDSPDQWQTLHFPLNQLVAKRRGRRIDNAPMLQVCDITGFNLMISHGQHGPFSLQMRNLCVHSFCKQASSIES
ncbi:MAG: CIA30 family protein [bacterium]